MIKISLIRRVKKSAIIIIMKEKYIHNCIWLIINKYIIIEL